MGTSDSTSVRQHASLCIANMSTVQETHPYLAGGRVLPGLEAVVKQHFDEGGLAENFMACVARLTHGESSRARSMAMNHIETAIDGACVAVTC